MKCSPVYFHILPYAQAQQTYHEKWNLLCQKSKSRNLFYHPVIIEAAKPVGTKYQPDSVIAGYKNDELILIQPIKNKKHRFGNVIEILMMPRADGIEPIILEEEEQKTLVAFVDYLQKELKPDLIIAKSVSEEFYKLLNKTLSAYKRKVDGAKKGALLHLPATMETFWAQYKSNFRSQLKRKIKKGQEANLSFRFVHSESMPKGYDLLQALDNLTRLHRMRFDSIQRDSFFTKSEMQEFHQYLCTHQTDFPYRLTFTEALHEGRVVGSVYGIQSASVYIFLMIGFDPKYADLSPGNLLIYYTIENLINQKVELFDFKCGEESYKERWTKDYYTKYDMAVGLSLKGELLYRLHHSMHLLHKLREKPAKLYRRMRAAFASFFVALYFSDFASKVKSYVNTLVYECEYSDLELAIVAL